MIRSAKLTESCPYLFTDLRLRCSAVTPSPSHLQFQLINTRPLISSSISASRVSRRHLLTNGGSPLLLLLSSSQLFPAQADEIATTRSVSDSEQQQPEISIAQTTPATSSSCSADEIPGKKVFLDVSINGDPAGRIVIGLFEKDAPSGAARFASLVSGTAGVSYRRKEFVKIMPNYVQHGGLRSYGVDAEMAKKTGSDLARERLVEEWERAIELCPSGTKNLGGRVSIIVRDPAKPSPKLKLVARQGRLEIDQEEVGRDPNGTEFTISVKDSPELDASALVIGRVVEGMEVVGKIGQVKTVQENTSSPYFRVAKIIGDKRAVVAERGFNRPYLKVVVTNSGILA